LIKDFIPNNQRLQLKQELKSQEENQVYNLDITHIQKHILTHNGTFSFSNQNANMCFCGHSTAEHLDFHSTCLIPDCLCNQFLDKDFKISSTMLTRRGTIKKKNDRVQVHKPCVGDDNELSPPPNPDKSVLDSYIESLAQI
jgi:hypothetical protein